MVKTKTIYETSDGQTFNSQTEAEVHERLCEFRQECFKILAKHPAVINDQDIVNFLDTNSSALLVLLMNLHKVTAE